MATYDEALAQRMRALMAGQPGVTEKKMFGGLAFLVEGIMAIAASGEGGVVVRVDPHESDRIVEESTAEVAVMGGSPMPGWVRVPAEDLRTDRQVARWVRIGVDSARSLPAKR